MRKIPAALVWTVLGAQYLGPCASSSAQQTGPIMGFSPAHAAAEDAVERQFQSLPSPEQARKWHRAFSAEPHPAASAENNRLARVLAGAWRAQGWEDVTLRRYDVLHSRPRAVSLEMTSPAYFKASLREAAYAVDPDTRNPRVDGSYSAIRPPAT